MNDDLDLELPTTAPTPARRPRLARSGLLGLAAAGLVGAVALAAGAGLLPGGMFAATPTSSAAPSQQRAENAEAGSHLSHKFIVRDDRSLITHSRD